MKLSSSIHLESTTVSISFGRLFLYYGPLKSSS